MKNICEQETEQLKWQYLQKLYAIFNYKPGKKCYT